MNMESITGRVATDPTARVMKDGTMRSQFFIQDKQDVYFHVSCYRELAEGAAAFLKTGALVTVRGKCKIEEWIDHNDIKHWQTRILAIRIQILDPIESNHTEVEDQALG